MKRFLLAGIIALALISLEMLAHVMLVLEARPVVYPSGMMSELANIKSKIAPEGYITYSDFDGRFYHIHDGYRDTVGRPLIYQHTLWLFGNSSVFDVWVDDAHTLASQLQALYPSERIINAGMNGAGVANEYMRLMATPVQPGDTIVMIDGAGDMLNAAPHCQSNLAVIQLICQDNAFRWNPSKIVNLVDRYTALSENWTIRHGAQFYHFIQPDRDTSMVASLHGVHLAVPTNDYAEDIHLNADGDYLLAHELFDALTLI